MNPLSLGCALLTCLSVISGQVSRKGRWRGPVLDDVWGKSGNAILTYEMPAQDNAALLAEVLAEEQAAANVVPRKTISSSDGVLEISYPTQAPKVAPFRFGKVLPISLNISRTGDGQWIENEEAGTKMWRFKVHSPGAETISIYFDDFFMTPGSELYVIGQEETFGAFTGELNNKPERVFGIAPIAGDFLILEYIEPAIAAEHSSLVVSHIVHGFRSNPFSSRSRDITSEKSKSGSCNINVACPEGHGKTDMISSIALLINGKGDSFCTGTMINNALRDGRQLFLTADHCLSSDAKVSNFIAGFGYQMRYCKSSLEFMPNTKTVHGMKLLGRAKETDYALLEVVESIPDAWDVYLAGWDAAAANSRVGGFFGLHHPNGDVKKVSLYSGTLDLVRLTEIGAGVNFWRVSKWASGVTEPGSSGSALFDSQGYVIGHLYGGDSSCSRPDGPDYYGSLAKDWSLTRNPIKSFLDPKGWDITKVKGEYLKNLRTTDESESQSESEVVEGPASNPTDATITTVTATVTDTITNISTLFKATKTETQILRSTITPAIVTSTQTIVSTAVSISTVTRLQAVPTVTRTITTTVTKRK